MRTVRSFDPCLPCGVHMYLGPGANSISIICRCSASSRRLETIFGNRSPAVIMKSLSENRLGEGDRHILLPGQQNEPVPGRFSDRLSVIPVAFCKSNAGQTPPRNAILLQMKANQESKSDGAMREPASLEEAEWLLRQLAEGYGLMPAAQERSAHPSPAASGELHPAASGQRAPAASSPVTVERLRQTEARYRSLVELEVAYMDTGQLRVPKSARESDKNECGVSDSYKVVAPGGDNPPDVCGESGFAVQADANAAQNVVEIGIGETEAQKQKHLGHQIATQSGHILAARRLILQPPGSCDQRIPRVRRQARYRAVLKRRRSP